MPHSENRCSNCKRKNCLKYLEPNKIKCSKCGKVFTIEPQGESFTILKQLQETLGKIGQDLPEAYTPKSLAGRMDHAHKKASSNGHTPGEWKKIGDHSASTKCKDCGLALHASTKSDPMSGRATTSKCKSAKD